MAEEKIFVVATLFDWSEGHRISDVAVYEKEVDAKTHAEIQIGNYLKEFDSDERIDLEHDPNNSAIIYSAESKRGDFIVQVMPQAVLLKVPAANGAQGADEDELLRRSKAADKAWREDPNNE